jgi:hypothetical protein
MSEEKRKKLRISWKDKLIYIDKIHNHQNLHSIGQTAVASIPPAIHPATMGISGFFFFTSAFVIYKNKLGRKKELRKTIILV